VIDARFDVVPPTLGILEPADGRHRERAVVWGALSAGLGGVDQSEASVRQRAERLGIVSLVVHVGTVWPRSDSGGTPAYS